MIEQLAMLMLVVGLMLIILPIILLVIFLLLASWFNGFTVCKRCGGWLIEHGEGWYICSVCGLKTR